MLIRSLMKIIGVGVLAFCTCTLFAQDGPPYPPGYPFGDNGNANHPNGYDGYPGGHPDNPNSPHGGRGGNGVGSGNGGFGGAGAPPGGDGGVGGDSGDDGGSGGGGGAGGENEDGTGGAGGAGGEGVDAGGVGGRGGPGTSGGTGGCGGNATGTGGVAGGGGKGGTASEGIGGTGGCGGSATGSGGCGGDSGDGGDSTGTGRPGVPGSRGPGVGSLPTGDPCNGSNGDFGTRLLQAAGPKEMLPLALSYSFSFPALHSIPLEDKEAARVSLLGWRDIVGPEIKIGTDRYPPMAPNKDGIFEYWCLLHPNSLDGDTLRIEIEARIDGQDPLLQVLFGANADIGMTPTIPMPLEDEWRLFQFTIARPESGIAMGNHLDMFTYSGRDYEVRSFKVVDLGKKGDVNLDQVVDIFDLLIVSENYAQEGDIGIESGDTNLDGVVDIEDVLNVINGIE